MMYPTDVTFAECQADSVRLAIKQINTQPGEVFCQTRAITLMSRYWGCLVRTEQLLSRWQWAVGMGMISPIVQTLIYLGKYLEFYNFVVYFYSLFATVFTMNSDDHETDHQQT